MAATRGFGIAGTLDLAIIKELARAAEEAGYSWFWSNDTPNGDGLVAVAEASKVTSDIDVGVGVVPIDHRNASQIVQRVSELEIPADRGIIGVGSGGITKGALNAVRSVVPEVRERAHVRVYNSALGPKMCQVGGEVADGILLGWVTPDACKIAVELVKEAAEKAGRPRPKVAVYVRTALPAGAARIRSEGERYAGYPAYAANFKRMNATHEETTAFGNPEQIQARLAAFSAYADEVIVRAIVANETSDDYLELLAAAAL